MDIVAESLSAKILKSREVLVNGKDIMDYIRSKLSTAVEFSGVYDDINNIPISAQFNGSIVIVNSKEYIYSDKSEPNHWQEIGDETAVCQLTEELNKLSGDVSTLSIEVAAELSNLQNHIDAIEYKSFAIDNTIITANSAGNYSSFQLKMQAFKGYEASKLYIQTGGTYSELIENQQLSIVGSTASTASAIAESNTYFKSDLTTYPTAGQILSASLAQVQAIDNLNAPMYFFFSTSDGYKQARLSVAKTSTIPSPDYIHTMNFWYPLVSVAASYEYALTSDIPTYSDISTNIHLSDYALTSQLSSAADISNAIGLSNYALTADLSEISTQVDEKYDQLVGQTTDLSSADTIYGAKTYASDLVNSLDVTDTPTAGKFVVAVSQENGVISVQKAVLTIPEGLSSYADTKHQLSNDGYATQSSIPSYSDISTNIHLSNYALANSVSSTTELNAKFNTLSTYSQTKQQLSSDGYAQTTDIPTYSDISSNIHLSDYALTSQLSSAADISVAIKLQEQLDTKNKVEIAHELSGAFTQTDLSIIKVTDGNLQTYAESLSTDTINPNAIYMLQLSAINAFGQQIHNVADGTISSDAATCGQLQKLYQMIVELSGKIS